MSMDVILFDADRWENYYRNYLYYLGKQWLPIETKPCGCSRWVPGIPWNLCDACELRKWTLHAEHALHYIVPALAEAFIAWVPRGHLALYETNPLAAVRMFYADYFRRG